MSKDVAAIAKTKGSKPKNGFFKKVTRFFKDLRSEFKKIVWPTKKQTLNNTGVVIIFMAISAIAIWSLDWVFISLFKLILG